MPVFSVKPMKLTFVIKRVCGRVDFEFSKTIYIHE